MDDRLEMWTAPPPLWVFVLAAIAANGALFFASGGLLHWWFYVRRAGAVARWRLQADRPLPTAGDLRKKLPTVLMNIAIFNGIVGASFWAIVSGHSRLVTDARAVSLPILVLSSLAPPVLFHLVTYVVHRTLHTPFLFRHIHSVHHRARAPVFLDAHYMHPLEAVYSGVALMLPAFLVPAHVWAFVAYFLLVGVHELLDHTGVRLHMPGFSGTWFHDEHHRSVRRCYGQTFSWLDRLLGTGPRAEKRSPSG